MDPESKSPSQILKGYARDNRISIERCSGLGILPEQYKMWFGKGLSDQEKGEIGKAVRHIASVFSGTSENHADHVYFFGNRRIKSVIDDIKKERERGL